LAFEYKEFPLTLDLVEGTSAQSSNKKISLSQRDIGVSKILFSLTFRNVSYPIPAGAKIRLFIKRYNSGIVMQDQTPETGAHVVVTDAQNGKLEVLLNTDSIATPGQAEAQIEIELAAGKIMTSQKFNFFIEAALGANGEIISGNDIPMLDKALEVGEKFKDTDLNTVLSVTNDVQKINKKTATVISLDEYESYIPNKNTISDPALWDWSAPLNKASQDVINKKIATTIKVTGFKKFNSSVTLDVTYASYDFTDSELDFSAINDGSSSFIFEGGKKTWNNLSYQNMRYVKGLFMRGAGKTSNSKGITFNSPTGSAQGVSFWHCDIKEFGTCMSFEQNAYLLSFFNCSVGRGNIGVHMPPGFTNYGENIAFFGGVLGNCNLAIKNENPNGNFHFNGTSIDYSGAVAEAVAGGIFFNNNHIEHNNTGTPLTDIPFKTGIGDSAKIVFSNVFLMFWTVPNLDYLFYTENTKQAGGIKFVNTTLFNVKTNTGILCGGTGLIEFVGDPILYEGTGNMSASPITSLANNKLIDGVFEDSAILDAYISKDTTTINNRTTGTNLQLTLDSTVFYEGTKSLKINKVGGASSASGISFMVPIDSGRHHSWQLRINKGTVSTGIMYITDYYVNLLNVNTAGIPTFQKTKTKATRTIDMTALAAGWQKQTAPLALSKAPKWATHYVVTFNLDAIGEGAFNLDQFIVTSL
jgi:hypothetical protein